MAYIPLTETGYQDPIKELKNSDIRPSILPPNEDAVDITKTKVKVRFPPIENNGHLLDRFNYYTYPERGNERSIAKQRVFNVKHLRSRYNPSDIYRVPATSFQEIGWHLEKDKRFQSKDSWIYTRRFPAKLSDITAFAEQMAESDRLFSMY